MSNDHNPYAVLDVHAGNTDQEIRNRFMELARIHHPDKGGDGRVFSDISLAYRDIRTGEARAKLHSVMAFTRVKCEACAGKGYAKTYGKKATSRACATCRGCGFVPKEKRR